MNASVVLYLLSLAYFLSFLLPFCSVQQVPFVVVVMGSDAGKMFRGNPKKYF